jgi:haloalkane dehalogenase
VTEFDPAVRRAYVDTRFGQVHYRLAGVPTDRPLVMLHQSPSSSAMWESVMPLFAARGWYVVAPDLLGHGGTDPGCVAPTLADYASGVWAALDALGLEVFDLVGHHSGASIGVLMATQRPARMRALALWGVALMTPERQHTLGTEQAPDWQHAEDWLGTRWLRRRSASGQAWTVVVGRRALIELMQAGPNSQWLHNAVANSPIEPLLASLAQPVLTICGERDTLYAESEQAARYMPHARFVPLHGTGLDIADQHPDLFVGTVAQFLNQHIDLSVGAQ